MTFDAWILGIARQHKRQFVESRFGRATGEIGPEAIKRAAHRPEEPKPLKNLLQEQPEKIRFVRWAGGETVRGELAPDATTADLFDLAAEFEQAATVEGDKARLHAYFAPGETPYLVRESFEPDVAPAPEAKPRRAAARKPAVRGKAKAKGVRRGRR